MNGLASKKPQDIYLDYVNNYLTVKYMAECYGITESKLLVLIKTGKTEHEKIVANNKLIKKGLQTVFND